jgi:RNA polymerase sigma factor (sigma-70 family)
VAGAASPDARAALADLVRTEGTAVLATLTRVVGDLGLAEDSVQDAAERALQTWPRDGVPDNPRAWLAVTARRRAIDVIRRETHRDGKEAAAMALLPPHGEDEPWDEVSALGDDLLRLVFTCCHPALSLETQVALSLRTLGGLSTAEVARALLVPEATMAKRLTRARQKIARARIPYRVPDDAELPQRLAGVAATVYLIFNEGYASADEAVVRGTCADEAIRLGRLLAALMPDEPTVLGLLALMLLQDARRATRVDEAGDPVLLADQDRSRWDRAMVAEGMQALDAALRHSPERPDPYVAQAAIAACHAVAPSWAATGWGSIVSWYDTLLAVQDTPVVRLNRAAAVAERDGPAAGLELLDGIAGLEGYPWWHAGRAELLRRLGRGDEARAAADRAAATGLGGGHVALLRRRIEAS